MDCKYIFIHYASQKGILQLHKGRMTFIYGLVISNWDKLKKKKKQKDYSLMALRRSSVDVNYMIECNIVYSSKLL